MSDEAGLNNEARVEELLAACTGAVSRGDSAGALRSSRAAVELAPDNWRAQMMLGLTLGKSGDAAAAVVAGQEACKLALNANTRHFGPFLVLGIAYAKAGRLDLGKDTLQTALELAEPGAEKSEVLTNLGTLLTEAKESADAEASFRQAIAENPATIEPRAKLFMLLAVSVSQAEKATEVAAGIADIVKQRPLTAREKVMVADVQKLMGMLGEAVAKQEAFKAKQQAKSARSFGAAEPLRRRLELWTYRSRIGRRLAFLIRPLIGR